MTQETYVLTPEQYVIDNIVKDRVGITDVPVIEGLSKTASESIEKQVEQTNGLHEEVNVSSVKPCLCLKFQKIF